MKKYVPVALAAFVLAGLTACNLSFNKNNNVVGPSPVETPRATVTPTPRATQASGESDVSSMAIFLYGYNNCPAGVTPPQNHALFQVPVGCNAELTATPKKTDGTDAKNHGSNLTWAVLAGGDVATIAPQSGEPTFNRTLRAIKAGAITLQATLVAPDGQLHVATRTITVL